MKHQFVLSFIKSDISTKFLARKLTIILVIHLSTLACSSIFKEEINLFRTSEEMQKEVSRLIPKGMPTKKAKHI
jgi:hypothetical protein